MREKGNLLVKFINESQSGRIQISLDPKGVVIKAVKMHFYLKSKKIKARSGGGGSRLSPEL